MLFDYQKHIQKSQEFIKELSVELEMPDDEAHSERVLTAVLHSLRDMLMPQESLHLISELPLYIQAVYIHGWKMSDKPERLKHLNDFLLDVKEQAGNTSAKDFGDIENTRKEVESVFRILRRHISEGELKDIKSQLPADIGQLLKA